MPIATFVPDLAIGFAEKLSAAIDTGEVEALSADEVSTAVEICRFLRDLFAKARQSMENALRAGVDARAFAASGEKAVEGMNAIRQTVGRVVHKAQASRRPALAEFVANYQELANDLANLQRFLADAVVKAKTPVRPIDWKKVQEAEAAYDRGETRPFQRPSTNHIGE